MLCNHILWGVGTLTQVKGLEGSGCSIPTTIIMLDTCMYDLGPTIPKGEGARAPWHPDSYIIYTPLNF